MTQSSRSVPDAQSVRDIALRDSVFDLSEVRLSEKPDFEIAIERKQPPSSSHPTRGRSRLQTVPPELRPPPDDDRRR